MHNDEVQRSEEWYAERLGIPTASKFNDLLTQPKSKADKEAGNLSQTALSYAMELVAERLTHTHKEINARSLEHGRETEPEAVQAYEDATGNKVIECGFIRHTELACGASPDGLIGLDGGLEIKCPASPAVHIKNLFTSEIPKEYYAQVQGQMWIGDLDWVDFASYNPLMPDDTKLIITRIKRDQEFIDNLEAKIKNFLVKVNEIEAKINGAKAA